MSKLIRAQFSRLFRSKLFIITLIVYFLLGIASMFLMNFFYLTQFDFYSTLTVENTFNMFSNLAGNPMVTNSDGQSLVALLDQDFLESMNTIYIEADGAMMSSYYIFAIVSALTVIILIGSEFHYNTVRNKIICGHSRKSVYLSNLVVCISSNILVQAVFSTATLLVGIFFVIKFHATEQHIKFIGNLKIFLINNLIGLGTIFVYCALFVFIAMITASQSRTAASSILITAVFILLSLLADQKLYQFEYVPYDYGVQDKTVSYMEIFFTDDSYDTYSEFRDKMRGKELSKPEAAIYSFLDDSLPTSQVYKLTNIESEECLPGTKRFLVYDYGFTVIITVVGLIIFSRKDIK